MKKLLILLLLTLAAALFAIPGVRDPLPVMSGEYVYYRDYTFFSETYVGFLQYDEETLALRYVALNPESGSSEVITLVSLNGEKDFIDIVGEKVLTEITEEDINIVNYLHDMLYEFAGRRKKLNGKNLSDGLTVEEDFFQFGGQAALVYEQAVPLFNLRRITGEDGKMLLEAVTFGQLESSKDNSFFDYQPNAKAEAELKKEKSSGGESITADKKTAQTVRNGAQTAVLDGNWSQPVENMWMFGNYALFMLDTLQINAASFTGGKFALFDYFTRNFLSNTAGSYTLLPDSILKKTPESLRVETLIFTPQTKELTRTIKLLNKNTDDEYFFAVLSIYEDIYQANQGYFNAIIDSISAAHE